jgi:hypothetical protein
MSVEIVPYIPVVIVKVEDTYTQSTVWSPRPYVAQVITNPELRAQGETRDDALKRLKGLLKARFICGSDGFEIVNMDLNEILIEEIMDT